ncbi:hypothetical protein NQ318_014235 [Aromia moschata]|uniref:lysozyme n=1 Tax=Aromia moschata TaxID=1265417 RepID=A0AAV8YYT2_9CUCU|nr:hypothetical protein NQ318_014235 [Aromia moschata]
MNIGTVVLLSFVVITCEGIENFLNNPLYSCVECLCHARTGCWLRRNCASYSISKDYWRTAGSLSANPTKNPGSEDQTYRECMRNENCIVGTIIKYTEHFGPMDCNCDGKFDCKDRAAIHLFGQNCENPKYGQTYANRFNHCANRIGVKSMLSAEGSDTCNAVEVF